MSEIEEEDNKRQRAAEPLDRKTIYILNLPENVSEREIRNFLIFLPGFQKVQLYDHNKNNNPVAQARNFVTMGAFALFESQSCALSAKDRIEGFMFDPLGTLPLDCRLAMKNLVMSRQEHQQMMTDGSKRGGAGGPGTGAPLSSPPVPYGHPPPQPYYQPPPPPPQGYDYSPYGPPASGGYPYYPPNPPSPYPMPPAPAPAYYPYPPPPPAHVAASPPGNSGSDTHAPGNTLFLSNLALVSEQELRSIAVDMAGYRDSKFMTDKRSQRVAFIAFHSIEHAEQGLRFFSTYKNLRVSYSKNPLGEYNPNKRRAMGGAPDSSLY